MDLPIGPLVPLDSEIRWSDLLAVLIETDPEAATRLLGLGDPPGTVNVRREVGIGGRDRIDLIAHVDGSVRTVLEVKVLSGLGRDQLARYRESVPDAKHHLLVHPARLPIDLTGHPGWRSVPWEDLLAAFAGSADPWVARTAAAWRTHLEQALPHVEAATQWDDIGSTVDFAVALRMRMAWVYERLRPRAGIVHDLVVSSAGRSAVARMITPAARAGYFIIAEMEERLGPRDYASRKPEGPSIKVCLQQTGVTTSAGYDWDYLAALWPTMNDARSDWWAGASARPPAPHDRENWQRIIAQGTPAHVGSGFGDREAQKSGTCMFGARIQLHPDVTLTNATASLQGIADLVLTLAAQEPPSGE